MRWSQPLILVVDGVNLVLGPILVCFGLSLLAFLVGSFYLFVLPIAAPTYAWPIGCVGAYLFFQVGLHYVLCISTDPGRLASPSHPIDKNDVESVEDDAADLPVCHHCDASKPPRAHHCHSCGVCVLDLDHHCVWVHNCIGRFNYGFYWRFLLFTWLACAFIAVVAYRAIQAPGRGVDTMSSFDVYVRLPYVLSLCVGLVVFGLWLWHVYVVLAGTTTLEAVILYRTHQTPNVLTWAMMKANVHHRLGSLGGTLVPPVDAVLTRTSWRMKPIKRAILHDSVA